MIDVAAAMLGQIGAMMTRLSPGSISACVAIISAVIPELETAIRSLPTGAR